MTWKITSSSLQPEKLIVEESLFSLANGYLGVRGNFEEGYAPSVHSIRGTYINAFHEIVDIPYGEKLFGFPSTQQKIANGIDAQSVELYLGDDEEQFSLFEGEVISYERVLHLDKGYSERRAHWRSPKGKEIIIAFRRLVSFENKELFSIQIRLLPVNFFGKVKIISTVNGNVTNYVNDNDPRVGSGHAKILTVRDAGVKDGFPFVLSGTAKSNLEMSCVTSYLSENGTEQHVIGENYIQTEINFNLTREIVFEKRNVYTDTLRHGEKLVKRGIAIQERLSSATFDELLSAQAAYVGDYWHNADVIIHGDEKVQQGIRFNLFHLLQSAGRDSYSNIAAKGLSGEGYEGHYFWDTEIYMLPVFILTKPEIARQLLIYRYSILDDARARALEMGHRKGALFPWRTISGKECSSYFPSGSAQYHISADIAYSFIQYYLVTKDIDFIKNYGAEVLFETARLWLEVGHFYKGKFKIDAVTGPDEYTCVINNNYYTNAMAKFNLKWAVKIYNLLKNEDISCLKNLQGRLNLTDSEKNLWQEASEQMYMPYNAELDINPQDDTFLQKEVWDFDNTPKEHYPLLLHYHPLTLYRYQVCKQADTVLAHFLLEDEQAFSTIKNSYHYYEKVTTHDSSLSSCIFSIMAAKIGDVDKAYQYFIETARLDLDNTHKNTKDGLHLANMGGTWLAILFGFARMRIKESGLYLSPSLPDQWDGYEASFQFQGRKMHVKVTKDEVNISLSGEPLKIYVYEKAYSISDCQPLKLEPVAN